VPLPHLIVLFLADRGACFNVIVRSLTMVVLDDERFPAKFGRSVRAVSDYMGIGLQIAASFAFFVFLGYWADTQAGTSPLLLLAGVVVGMGGMALVLMKVVRTANAKKK
jgi:F0F1-type ATP synthase assembly protein I